MENQDHTFFLLLWHDRHKMYSTDEIKANLTIALIFF